MPRIPEATWIQSSPSLFLRAIEGGSQAGIAAAKLEQDAAEARLRRQTALDQLAAEESLAGQRLAQAERIAQMEDATRRQVATDRGEYQSDALAERLGLGRERLALDREKMGDLNDYRAERLALSQALAEGRLNPGSFEPSARDIPGAPGVREIRDSAGKIHIVNPGWMERLMQNATGAEGGAATNAAPAAAAPRIRFVYEPGKGLVPAK